MEVRVFDGVLADAAGYRVAALASAFMDIEIGGDIFRGIGLTADRAVPDFLEAKLPGALTTLSFFRKSPKGQIEPNDIHSDVDMGDYTGILYLNPTPAEGDGTLFWRRRDTGLRRGQLVGDAGRRTKEWEVWQRVGARFGRLLVFRSDLFHSRALLENFGDGDDARLIQVVFLRGGV